MALPQRPVGLDMNLSQPNVRRVPLPQKSHSFSLAAYRDFWAILLLHSNPILKHWEFFEQSANQKTIFPFSQLWLARNKISIFRYACHVHWRPSSDEMSLIDFYNRPWAHLIYDNRVNNYTSSEDNVPVNLWNKILIQLHKGFTNQPLNF